MNTAGTEQAPSESCRRRARRAYPTSKGFQRAYIRGWYAALGGKGRDANPYRKAIHGSAWTFAWRAAWTRGFDSCPSTWKRELSQVARSKLSR